MGLNFSFLRYCRIRTGKAVITLCLSALPFTDNNINVNTANALTLATLDDGIGLGSAEAITMTDRAFQSVEEFVAAHPEFAAVAEDLTVRSEHFAMHAQAVVGDASVTPVFASFT